MPKINFGPNLSIPVQPYQRTRAENFCSQVLKLEQVSKGDHYTCYKFSDGQVLGITPDSRAPSEEEYENSIWLEITTSDFETTKQEIINFGAKEVQGGAKQAYFFNLPGGPVFRLISKDMIGKI